MGKDKKYLGICFIFQILFLGVLLYTCIDSEQNYVDTKFAYWHSELFEYNSNTWSIDGCSEGGGETIQPLSDTCERVLQDYS